MMSSGNLQVHSTYISLSLHFYMHIIITIGHCYSFYNNLSVCIHV